MDDDPKPLAEWIRWVRETDDGVVVLLREVVTSVGVVLLVGLLLFAVSGLWPPMVAVTSGSMEPNLERGDLVFVMEEHRFAPGSAHADTGIVPYRTGQRVGYRKFGAAGDVIVFQPSGDRVGTPVIHRARFWVNESENWVANGKAQPEHLGSADSCGQLAQCPAPHAGFITKGDNPVTNTRYDQVTGLSGVIKPAWVIGTAEFGVPWLGNVRLWAEDSALAAPSESVVAPGAAAAGTGETAAGGTDEAGTRHCAWS